MSPNPNSIVSPEAYVQQQFGTACEELGVNPQETVLLLLFDFLRTTPENRGVQIVDLKKAFNTFAASVDFKELQVVIDQHIYKAELQLYDSLATGWEDQDTGANSPTI